MLGPGLIEYLQNVLISMKRNGSCTTQVSEETVNLLLTELIDNRNEIERLKNCVMSEDQVKRIMQSTCHDLMSKQCRIYEINGALEAITELEAKCNDAATLHEMYALAMHYKKLIGDFILNEE